MRCTFLPGWVAWPGALTPAWPKLTGASSPSSPVVPSMVTVSPLSHTRGYGFCIGLLAQGKLGTSGTLGLHQHTPR